VVVQRASAFLSDHPEALDKGNLRDLNSF